jgi:hypothetical protein
MVALAADGMNQNWKGTGRGGRVLGGRGIQGRWEGAGGVAGAGMVVVAVVGDKVVAGLVRGGL